MSNERQKEKRLHVGGVGPEMRSPAGLRLKHSTRRPTVVNRLRHDVMESAP